MAKKHKKQQAKDASTLAAVVAAVGLGLLIGLFALGKRGREGDAGRAGSVDRALGTPSQAAGDGGSATADTGLNLSEADRAPDHFRPDPTAGVDAENRDAFAPATMANPAAAQPA